MGGDLSLKELLRKLLKINFLKIICINLLRLNALPRKFKNLISLDGFSNIYNSNIQVFNENNDAVSRDLCIFGIPKKEKVNFTKFKEVIKNADSFLDVGAGIGLYSLFAMSINPEIKILSVEANPYVYEKLLKNINNHENESAQITTLNKAVLNDNKNINFYIPTGDDYSYATVNKELLENKKISYEKIEIEATDLVDSTNSKFDVIKIDVEGAELDVLKAIINKIENCRFLFIEIMQENKKGVFDLLNKLSFSLLIDSDENVGNYVFKSEQIVDYGNN